MKVLVTGGSGFLGGYVLSGLRRYGIDTVVAGRHRPSWDATTDFIKIDLLGTSDFAPLFAESDVTHLLHLAWYAEHDDYWTSSFNLRWVEATVRLVEAFCESGGQKVVAAGSCAEYEWGPGHFFEDRSTVNPASLYGVAKDAGRRLMAAICARHQVPCAWGRIFFPFGTGEDGRRLIPSLIKVFQGEHPPFGVNALSCLDFLHATDVAEGFIKLLVPNATGVYNVSSGNGIEIAELVRSLAARFDADPRAVLALKSKRSGESHQIVGDNAKLKALGWNQSLPFEHGLDRTIRDLNLLHKPRTTKATGKVYE